MNREEFEKLYLYKQVRVTLFDNKLYIGELHNSQEKIFKNNPNLYFKYNYYVLLPTDNFIFRKSHIKKIEVE